MVFSTIIFLCAFLPLTIIGYYLLPMKVKNIFLLLASLFFYAWGEPKFILVMLASIVCNYLLGLGIARTAEMEAEKNLAARKPVLSSKLLLTTAVVLNLGILFVFKYLNFATENLAKLSARIPVLSLALPIGISFYTFQGLSYVIDVYREETAAGGNAGFVQRNPIKLALYISMFPQLIAGPIVRYKDIKDSLDVRIHSADQFADGVTRFVIGMSKKVILANMTGKLAAQIMGGNFSVMSMQVAWLGAIAYTLQIYFDFSGYSDMAIGLGKIFGFSFLENFNYPYISTSVSGFWRRWHMSLSGWFRDYLYIPLGGSRTGNVYFNLLMVFLATGIWHGAAWGFLLWGLWHGFFVLLERGITNGLKKKKQGAKKQLPDTFDEKKPDGKRNSLEIMKSLLGWLYTMVVVVIGWVLFNLVSVRDFVSYVAVMFGKNIGHFQAFGLRYYLSNQMIFYLVLAVLACVPWKAVFKKTMPKLCALASANPSENAFAFGLLLLKRVIVLGLVVLCYMFIINSSYNPFIYFRF